MIRKTCLLASLLLPVSALNAATINIANGDFTTALPTTLDPSGWTTSEYAGNNPIYVVAGGNGFTSSLLHFKDGAGSTTMPSVTQDLSANNGGVSGLNAATYGNYTLTLDLGWCTDRTSAGAATGNADLRFSLVNLTDSTVLGFTNYTLTQRTPTQNNFYTLDQDNLEINITYDNTQAGLDSANIGLRIARLDADNTATEGDSTIWFDNLSLTAVSAVPEPSVALLGGLGLLGLLRRRRA